MRSKNEGNLEDNLISPEDAPRSIEAMIAQAIMSYIRVRPTQLASAFAKADQAAHMIAVVLDQEAITSGAVRDGAPWKHYDLGHSYCSNAFWSTCPHRMACAGCFFNVPKQSAKGLILAAQQSAGRLLEEVCSCSSPPLIWSVWRRA